MRGIVNRAGALVTLCLAALVAGGSSGAVGALLFHITVYAPEQVGSPLRVVGFQYEEGFIRLALLNDSDKSIANVSIAAVEVAPPGCGAEPRTRIHVGGSVETLHIPPHGTIVTPGRGTPPTFPAPVLITNAQRLKAASLQVQIVVMEVDFVDGTKWRSREELPQTPFDSALVDIDAGECPDVAAVTKALSTVDRFEFDRGIEKASLSGGGGETSPPRLSFSCTLEGSKAVCPF